MLASLHAEASRQRSLLGLCYRRSWPDGDHGSQCVDPRGGPHRDRNLGPDRDVGLVHWLDPPLCPVGAAMNAFVLSGLVKRRAQLGGDIENTHEALRKMVLDLGQALHAHLGITGQADKR
jgi:hypothetical protein